MSLNNINLDSEDLDLNVKIFSWQNTNDFFFFKWYYEIVL